MGLPRESEAQKLPFGFEPVQVIELLLLLSHVNMNFDREMGGEDRHCELCIDGDS